MSTTGGGPGHEPVKPSDADSLRTAASKLEELAKRLREIAAGLEPEKAPDAPQP